VQAQYEAALAEDASVFDYDGVYDNMQQAKVQPKQQEKIERKSRCASHIHTHEHAHTALHMSACLAPLSSCPHACKTRNACRYIAQLKEQAEERKRESDIQFERKQLKDRTKEDHLFADKEVFVTGAYRRKLEEQKLWMENEKKKWVFAHCCCSAGVRTGIWAWARGRVGCLREGWVSVEDEEEKGGVAGP
jgi:coiled-coil domain-containing protein 55